MGISFLSVPNANRLTSAAVGASANCSSPNILSVDNNYCMSEQFPTFQERNRCLVNEFCPVQHNDCHCRSTRILHCSCGLVTTPLMIACTPVYAHLFTFMVINADSWTDESTFNFTAIEVAMHYTQRQEVGTSWKVIARIAQETEVPGNNLLADKWIWSFKTLTELFKQGSRLALPIPFRGRRDEPPALLNSLAKAEWNSLQSISSNISESDHWFQFQLNQ